MFPTAPWINLAGWAHLAFFGVGIPSLVVALRRKVAPAEGPLPNRLRHFQNATIELLTFGVVSLLVASTQRMQLFPAAFPSAASWLAGAAVLGLQVCYMRPRWRRAVERRSRVVHLFMPSTSVERTWWAAVSVLAGVSEEITWRGVQWTLLGLVTHNSVVAAALCAVMFGAVHMVQGWRSSVGIVGFALSFHLLVWLGGSLYVAMAVHVAYDVIAGLSYGRLGRELGYTTDAAATR